MSELLYLISEEGIAIFFVVVLLIGIGLFGRWFSAYFTNRLDSQFAELLREVAEMQQLIIENNNKIYEMTAQLIHNQNNIQSDVNNIEGNLDILLKFIKQNGKN